MKQKFVSYATIIIFALLILPFSFMLIFKTPEKFSEQENRFLQQMPELNKNTFDDASFMQGFSKYISDQFPFRSFFVNVKGNAELALLKKENNNILFGKNGQLAIRNFTVKKADGSNIENSDSFDPVTVENAMNAIIDISKTLEDMGVPFAALIPPRVIDVTASAFDYPDIYSKKLLSFMSDKLKDINHVDIAADFINKYDNGEYVYYKTDHHWTSLGAYYSYAAIMESFGLAPYPLSDFDITTASSKFYGTIYSKSGFKSATPDIIEYYVHKTLKPQLFNTVTYRTTNTGYEAIKELDGFFDTDFLEVKDKYSSFLSGINTLTRITQKDGTRRETLLLLSDSFGNSIAPFLALHFDIVMINFNVFNDLSEKAERYNLQIETPERVVFMYNVENIVAYRTTESSLKYLPKLFK